MKNVDFKNALNLLKEQKNKSANENGKKFVKYGDVMKEKIKENKAGVSVLRNFEDFEKERGEWYKIRNTTLNKEKEPGCDKSLEIFSKDPILLNNDSIEEIEPEKESKEFLEEVEENEATKLDADNIEKKKKREWIITVDPKTIITEITEDSGKIRVINADNYAMEYKCNELYNWFHIMFINWEKDLDLIPHNLRDGTDCRRKFGIYRQCRGYIKPLLRILKKKEITKEICNKLFEIMIFSIDKDYIRAHDKYIELAIGNAPWPMGVTMVGIHERTGRARIAKSQVANILNDEHSKKYLQSVKRIMSLVQRLNPTSPSLSVVS